VYGPFLSMLQEHAEHAPATYATSQAFRRHLYVTRTTREFSRTCVRCVLLHAFVIERAHRMRPRTDAPKHRTRTHLGTIVIRTKLIRTSGYRTYVAHCQPQIMVTMAISNQSPQDNGDLLTSSCTQNTSICQIYMQEEISTL
jgi:hypothetical protein